MYSALNARISGIAPLIMHNGQTADPLNRYAKLMKEISGKRKKTEADFMEMAKIEFLAGLYMGPKGPIIPAVMLEANLVRGARKTKTGQLVEAGVICDQHAILEYDGPRTGEELFANDKFRLSVPVRIG